MDPAVSRVRRQTLLLYLKEFCSSNAGSLRLAGLAGILLFSFWAGMSPHWDYPYPLHVDEWFAMGYAQSMLEAGALEYSNPYQSGEVSFPPEMGFHLILGFLKTTTGLSWLSLYRIAPGVLMALLAFLTFAFGRRAGFGWSAALFVSLIPTSVRTLGPTFVVPVSAAMLFIPATLLVLHSLGNESRGNESRGNESRGAESRGKALWILMLLIGGTIFIHPPTEVVVTGLAVLYLIGFIGEALAQRRYGDGVRLLLAVAVRISVPVLILGLWLPSLTKKALQDLSSAGSDSLTSSLGLHTGFFEAFGILAAAVSFLGLFIFIARGDFGVRSYMLPVFTGLLLAFLVFILNESKNASASIPFTVFASEVTTIWYIVGPLGSTKQRMRMVLPLTDSITISLPRRRYNRMSSCDTIRPGSLALSLRSAASKPFLASNLEGSIGYLIWLIAISMFLASFLYPTI